jgi:hypothetical protein
VISSRIREKKEEEDKADDKKEKVQLRTRVGHGVVFFANPTNYSYY